ncbi:hypothetical protein DIS24_g4222 [Lasiodiplodia hormozganensis]|uniref:RNase H type-1 domain-containing protein n=1 Tax=Lasiodiplodia hormozganensis TaxID=869390 RepID=A0AA39YW03_9PEZI|nr:hypothetical protein DIS24_g4222 [Lasiodiplodia hormozganensis]
MSDHPPTALAIAVLMNPPPAPLTWKDFEPLVAKCAALVRLEKDHSKAKAFATRYSDRRADDGVLALFCDGSASGNIPAGVTQAHLGGQECKIKPASRRWTSSSVAFRKNPTDKEWQMRGYPTPLLFSNNNAELDGFYRAMVVAQERLAVDFTIAKLLIFTDAQTLLKVILKMARTRQLPDWDWPLLFKVMQKMVELSETPDVKLEFHWQPGHRGVEGNVMADLVAGLVRPDKLWPEAYPTETGTKNRSKRLGNMAAMSTSEHSASAQQYVQHRQSQNLQKHARNRIPQLSLMDVENLDPDVPIPSIEDPDIPMPSVEDPDIPIPSVEEDYQASQKDNEGARDEQMEGESDSDSDGSILSDPRLGPLYYELDRGWRESGPERKTKEQEEEERKRKEKEEDEESFHDPLYGRLLRILTEGRDKPLYGEM